MSICNDNKPVSKCHGQSDVYRDLRQNNRPQRMTASSFLDEKKAFTVLGGLLREKEAQGQNDADNNNCVTNVGGPGDKVQSVTDKCCNTTGYKHGVKNRLNGYGKGVDQKHGSYERYLARKRGWNIIQQNCK
tara:strand:+ start:6441 stop:6836 length:396 start_codon:yes stop_codon:yes gene_type:complete